MEIGDRKLESVEVVNYLGEMVSGDGRMEIVVPLLMHGSEMWLLIKHQESAAQGYIWQT